METVSKTTKPKDISDVVSQDGEFIPRGDPVAPPADNSEPKGPPDPFEDKWKWLHECGADWLTTEPPNRRWLLKQESDKQRGQEHDNWRGWLPLGKVAMIAAGGGVGKTAVLCQLALAVATGKDWLKTFRVPPEAVGHVLLGLGEEDEEEIRRRLFKGAESMELTTPERTRAAEHILPLPLAGTPIALTRTKAGNIEQTENLARLRERLTGAGVDWRLVILDPLCRWSGDDTERDNPSATRFIEAVETLVRVPGEPTVMLAHHTTKAARKENTDDATTARGSSAIVDGVRWVATMTIKDRDKKDTKDSSAETVILKVSKSNYSFRGEPVKLINVEGAFGPASEDSGFGQH